MPKFSTARETLARLEKRIAEERDPRRKAWLSTYRNHWWGEVIGDVDQVMATMTHGPIRYSFDGHPYMVPDSGLAAMTDWGGTRAMYEGVVGMGVRRAGALDEGRSLSDEAGMAIVCVVSGRKGGGEGKRVADG